MAGPEYTNRNALYAQMMEELKHGHTSQLFLDKYRIADPAEYPEKMAKVQSYMNGLVQAVLGADYDPKVHKFRFLIAGDEKPNAGIIRDAVPPVVIFSVGLLMKLRSKDQLMGVLAHELTHFKLDTGGNSKFEELISDGWPVYALRKAGMNPKAMGEALDLLEEQKEEVDLTTLDGALSYLDPHPKTPLRKRVVENVQFALARDEGVADFNVPDTPLDMDFLDAVADCRHVSYVQRQQDEKGYEQQDAAGKLKILIDMVPSAFAESPEFYKERLDDLAECIKWLPKHEFTPVKSNKGIFDLLDQLIDNIFAYETTDEYNTTVQRVLYGAVSERFSADHSPYRPEKVGRLMSFGDALSDFVFSFDAEEAEAAAEEMKLHSKDFTFPGGSSMFNMRWMNFELPQNAAMDDAWKRIDEATAKTQKLSEEEIQDYMGITPIWEKHVQWALKAKTPLIGQALWACGIRDPRLIAAMKQDLPKTREWTQQETYYNDLMFSPNGKVIGRRESYKNVLGQAPYPTIGNEYKERLAEFEKRRLTRLNRAAEKEMQVGVDWQLLEQGDDFQAFVARYEEFLVPQMTPVEMEAPFINAFMTRIEGLLARDPDKYRPIVQQFFAGTTYQPDLSRRFDHHHKKQDLRTVQDMLLDATLNMRHMPVAATSLNGYKLSLPVSLSHPYIRFVLDDPHQLFKTEDKLESLKYARVIDLDPNDPEEFEFDLKLDLARVVGYERPKTPEALVSLLGQLQLYQYKDPKTQGSLGSIENQRKWEASVFLEGYTGHIPAVQMQHIAELDRSGADRYTPFSSRLCRALDAQLQRNMAHDLGSGPLDEFVMAYTTYAQHGLFGRAAETRMRYDAALCERIKSVSDPQKAKEITEGLLSTVKISNPKLRQQLMQCWVNAQTAILGLDDEMPAYHERVDGIVQDVLKKMTGTVAFDMLAMLATGVQAQEKLAFFIRDALKDNLQKVMTNSGGNALGIAGEYGLAVLSQDKKMRPELLEYLTAPLTHESTRRIYDAIQALEKEQDGRRKCYDFYTCLAGASRAFNLTEEQKIALIPDIHRNFWAMPLEGRAFFIEKILFPVEEKSEQEFERSVGQVLDGLFPEGSRYAAMGRLAVSAYLDNVPVYSQRMLLSALMVAREACPGAVQTDEDLGRTLALVLVNLGPAGVKLAQAIHSHPDTPEAIRAGMDDVKGRANLPYRWDVFTRMNDVLPQGVHEDIAHVGKTLGSGAFQFTQETTKQDGRETAMSLQHRNVRQRADTEFGHFDSVAEALIGEQPELSPLRDIMTQARNNVPVETDYDIGKQQADVANTLYDGMEITVNGRTIRFTTVEWLGHGAEYKDASIAPGADFNDLPEETQEQRNYKRDLAMAIVTAELYLILTGNCFDHDRHGANLKALSDLVTGFDYGGMALEKPSPEERALLGQAIAEAVKLAQGKNMQLGSAMISAISKLCGEIPGSDYMASVERGVLALGDYFKHLTAQDVEGIVGAIVKTGRVDPQIMMAVQKHADMDVLSAIFAKSAGRELNITISAPQPVKASPAQIARPAAGT